MSNKDELAFTSGAHETRGLTKREYFAAMAMQGCLVRSMSGYETIAEVSVKFADALLQELEK